MTDQTSDGDTQDTGDAVDTEATDTNRESGGFTQADVDRIVAERLKREKAAHAAETRELRKAAGEAEKLRQDRMSETEKATAEAVAKATAETRAAVLAEFGGRLVDAKFEALAAGRTVNGKPLNLGEVLAGVNRTYYLTEDGEVDTDKVTAFIDSVAPAADPVEEPAPSFPDLGQGPRKQTKSSPGDQFAAAVAPFFR